MKIIIAPSKTQTMRVTPDIIMYKPVVSLKDKNRLKQQEKITRELLKTLKKCDVDEISKKLKIGNELLKKTVEGYKHFKQQEEGYSILSYTGTVFKELEVDRYCEDEWKYLNEHLVILSALYGPIPAYKKIRPYRLDMTSSLFSESLYKVWEESVQSLFEEEDIIIDLASQEFSKQIKSKKIQVEFMETVEGAYKSIPYYSKRGRGLMLNYLAKNHIGHIEKIKEFKIDGYKYNKKMSTENKLIFTR